MANEFYPCLVQTTVWTAWTWEELRIDLPDELLRLIEQEDANGLLRFCKLPKTKPYRKAATDALNDLKNATGTVSAETKEAKEIITTVADSLDDLT